MGMKKVILAMIRFYQRAISPYTRPCCRYTPTCSQYAVEAVTKYGALKGSFLALKRLLRCNPLFPGGYDPVP
jgi:putative membrane protein insertion efficiency factor